MANNSPQTEAEKIAALASGDAPDVVSAPGDETDDSNDADAETPTTDEATESTDADAADDAAGVDDDSDDDAATTAADTVDTPGEASVDEDADADEEEGDDDDPVLAVKPEEAARLRSHTDPENLERIAAPNAHVRTVRCPFKDAGIEYIDYKDVETLKQYVNDQGKMLPRRMTGVSNKFQRQLTTAIKRARHVALLPFVADNVR